MIIGDTIDNGQVDLEITSNTNGATISTNENVFNMSLY